MTISLNPANWVQRPSLASTFSEGVCSASAAAGVSSFFLKTLNPVNAALFSAMAVARRNIASYVQNSLQGRISPNMTCSMNHITHAALMILTAYVSLEYLGFSLGTYAIYELTSFVTSHLVHGVFRAGCQAYSYC